VGEAWQKRSRFTCKKISARGKDRRDKKAQRTKETMTLLATTTTPSDLRFQSSPIHTEVLWYAAYTYPRHEKTVFEQLVQKSVECYLPLCEEVHRWTDRSVRVQLPLLPGYVFVRIRLSERRNVLSVASVIRILSFNGQPQPLPESEIEALKRSLQYRRVERLPYYLSKGDKVRIKSGPLQGLEGIVERQRGRSRIVISINAIMNSVAVDLQADDLEPAVSRGETRFHEGSKKTGLV
jgi:transcription antitermination factor NusG